MRKLFWWSATSLFSLSSSSFASRSALCAALSRPLSGCSISCSVKSQCADNFVSTCFEVSFLKLVNAACSQAYVAASWVVPVLLFCTLHGLPFYTSLRPGRLKCVLSCGTSSHSSQHERSCHCPACPTGLRCCALKATRVCHWPSGFRWPCLESAPRHQNGRR